MPDFAPIQQNDLEEIIKLQPPDWPDIVPCFKFYLENGFSYPVKAMIDNKIAGVGVSVIFRDTSWLAHIIVDPQHRKQGIGHAIVEHLLSQEEIRYTNTKLLIATKIGESVYQKHGFNVVSEYIFCKRETLGNCFRPSEKIIPFENKHTQPLLDLDLYVTGEDRSVLINRHLSKAMIFFDHGMVSGYYLPDLGEGLIIADSWEAGVALMKLKYSTVEKAVLPIENKSGIDFLKKNGFNETSRAKRMILGDPIPWRPEKIFSRIGGNLG